MIRSDQTSWMSTRSNYVEKPINEFWGLETDLPSASQKIITGLRNVEGSEKLDI